MDEGGKGVLFEGVCSVEFDLLVEGVCTALFQGVCRVFKSSIGRGAVKGCCLHENSIPQL